LRRRPIYSIVILLFRTETRELHEQKDKVQSSLIELRKNRDEAKKNFKLAESELKLYVSSEEKEKDKLEELKATLESNTFEMQEKKTYVTAFVSFFSFQSFNLCVSENWKNYGKRFRPKKTLSEIQRASTAR
jgi:hypothetical protein